MVIAERSATIRLRGFPWTRSDELLVPVAIYVGDPGVLVNGCDVLELSWSWGASRDSGVTTTADAGTGVLRLLDPDRRYDPLSPSSSVGIATTVRVLVAGVPAFRGRIDDADHDLDVATLTLVDDVAALAAVQFVETSVPAEIASTRVTRILDLAAWPADRRDIVAGGVALQAGTVAADAWSELLEVARNELGAVWLTPEGKVAYRPRAQAWAGGTPLVELGCPPSLTPLTGLALSADQSNLVNILSAARRGGTQATVSDAASLTRYGRHSHVQNDLEVATDGDRSLWQSFYLPRQREPARGVATVSARPTASAIATLLGLRFGGIVHVVDSGHGPDIDARARWLGTRWTATPDAVSVTAALGQDQSIGPVVRSLIIDTPAQWAAVFVSGTNTNTVEPGVTVANYPKYDGVPPPVFRADDEPVAKPGPVPVDDPPPPESTPGIRPADIVDEGGHPPEPPAIAKPQPTRKRRR